MLSVFCYGKPFKFAMMVFFDCVCQYKCLL